MTEKIRKFKLPLLILSLTALVYLVIFLIRIQFGPYGTIEVLIWKNILYSLVFITALLLLYLWGYRKIEQFSVRLILVGYLILVFVLIVTPALTSMDMYMYAMRGRIVSVYGENPYLKPTANFAGDLFFKNISAAWVDSTQAYGPLWTSFSSLITRIAPNSLDLTYLFYKSFAFIGNSIVLFLLYLIAKLRSFDKLKTKKVLFLYAWNPALLLEFINNGHNDIWMILFGVLALYFYYKKKDILILPCLVLAGLVKYIFWILIPIFLVFLIREKRLDFKKIFYSILISLILLIVVSLPFFYSLNSLERLIWHIGLNLKADHLFSPFLLAVLSFGNLVGLFWVGMFLSTILLIGRLTFSFAYFVNLFAKQSIIRAIAISLILFVLFVPSTTLPWYGTWFLPFLILLLNMGAIAFWTSVIVLAYPLLYSFGVSTLVLAMLFFIFFFFAWIKRQQGPRIINF